MPDQAYYKRKTLKTLIQHNITSYKHRERNVDSYTTNLIRQLRCPAFPISFYPLLVRLRFCIPFIKKRKNRALFASNTWIIAFGCIHSFNPTLKIFSGLGFVNIENMTWQRQTGNFKLTFLIRCGWTFVG